MHHYIKNGKPFASTEPLYYFEWVYGGGNVVFGFHGTEAEYAVEVERDKSSNRRLTKKTLVPEVSPPLS